MLHIKCLKGAMEEHYPSRLLLAWFIAKLMSHRGHAGHWKVTSMLSGLLIFKVEFCPVARTVHDDIWWQKDLYCLKEGWRLKIHAGLFHQIMYRKPGGEFGNESLSCSQNSPLKQSPGQRCPHLIPLYTTYLCTFSRYHQWTCDFIYSSEDFSYILTGD